ncbi:MAG: superoxide dismutase family protein [Asticcacaulis sp.]|uniref:superoxide dismutase family protein n=1 Tax=Asticcacaulis sp. TaxID=1872648 RepID=UPI003F7B76CF
MRSIVALCVFAGIALNAMQAIAQEAEPTPTVYSGQIKAPDGQDLGTVTVTPGPDGVILRVKAHGLAPGWHGMHFHEKGACTDDKFASAGGHVHAMTPVTHGFLDPGHNDAGDLPNLYVAADGTANVELFSNLVTATKTGDKPYLMDDDGSAVVIHAMPDDYKTQPIGGAGVRVGCAALAAG